MSLLSKSLIYKTGATTHGFGLVELMVSITIMMLLTSIILVRNTSFNGAILLRSQAYEVAFALRQAQLLALGGNNSGASGVVQQYGVYFDTAAANNQKYIIFHDVDANGRWDSAVDTQIGKAGTLDKRFEIRDVANVGGTSIINGGRTDYHVTFIRPNFDAKFNDGTAYKTISLVYIDISQTNDNNDGVGDVRRVEITNTGAIAVTSYP